LLKNVGHDLFFQLVQFVTFPKLARTEKVEFLRYYCFWQVTVRCACQRLKKEWLCCDAQAAQPKGTKRAVSGVGILPCDQECFRLAAERRAKEESEELRHRKSKEPEVYKNPFFHSYILIGRIWNKSSRKVTISTNRKQEINFFILEDTSIFYRRYNSLY